MPRRTLKHRKHKRHTYNNHLQKTTHPKIQVGVLRAEWCGHCKALRPEWDAMEDEINHSHDKNKYHIYAIEDNDTEKNVKIAKINSSLRPDNQLEFRGYPTIFRIEKNHLDEYSGDRNKDALIKWVRGGNAALIQSGGKRRHTKKGGKKMHKKAISLKSKSIKREKKHKKKEKKESQDSLNESEKLPFSPTSSIQRMIGGCGCNGGKDNDNGIKSTGFKLF